MSKRICRHICHMVISSMEKNKAEEEGEIVVRMGSVLMF